MWNLVNLHDTKFNKSTKYLLPTLMTNDFNLSLVRSYGFINVYVDFVQEWRINEGFLYLLFNPSRNKLESWKEFYDIYSLEKGYVYDLDVGLGVILLCFKLKEKFREFPKYLIQGKYSKFNQFNYIENFKKFDEQKQIILLDQFKVIIQSREKRIELEKKLGVTIHRDWELDSKPILEQEIFNIDNI